MCMILMYHIHNVYVYIVCTYGYRHPFKQAFFEQDTLDKVSIEFDISR